MQSFLLVGAGGAVGAMLRYGVAVSMRGMSAGFPVATLLVNVSGSLAMGLLAGMLVRTGAAEGWRLFAGVGILGGYTTFSAFSLDTVELIERGALTSAAAYVALSVAVSVAALFVGLVLARAVA